MEAVVTKRVLIIVMNNFIKSHLLYKGISNLSERERLVLVPNFNILKYFCNKYANTKQNDCSTH